MVGSVTAEVKRCRTGGGPVVDFGVGAVAEVVGFLLDLVCVQSRCAAAIGGHGGLAGGEGSL